MTKPNILIVEDDTGIRDMLKRMAEDLGYSATCAATYLHAKAIWSTRDLEGGFCVVVTDDEMPEEFGRLPKSHARKVVELVHDEAEVIVHSGHGRYRFQQLQDDYGCHLVTKGCVEELLQLLKALRDEVQA